jgi:hypothetical protein
MASSRDRILSELEAHQAKALAIIARGDVLLAPDAVPQPPLLCRARWELTRVLSGYQAFKHHRLFDPIIRTGPPDKARIAQQMKAECLALGEDFRAHVERCTNLDIAAHWDSYRPAVVKLLARVKMHLVRERWVTERMLLPPVEARVFGTDMRAAARV